MVALMSHVSMKGQDTLLSFSFLLIVRPFLHNDLSFQLARLFFLFFL